MKINLFLFKRKEDTFSIPSLEHYEWKIFNETDFVQANASPYEIFSKFMHLYKPMGFYTVGPDSILDKEFSFLNQCSYIVKRLWVHLENFDSFDDTFPPNNIFTTIHKHRYAEDNPLLSIITSTFHSGEKILRPLRSLQAQHAASEASCQLLGHTPSIHPHHVQS
jgi:hypothetical protein